jgi:hypothetical protein
MINRKPAVVPALLLMARAQAAEPVAKAPPAPETVCYYAGQPYSTRAVLNGRVCRYDKHPRPVDFSATAARQTPAWHAVTEDGR